MSDVGPQAVGHQYAEELKPDLPALEISLSVLAFVALLAARRWFMPGTSPSNANRSPGPPNV